MKISDLEKKLTASKDDKEKLEVLNELVEASLEKSPEKALDYGKQALELAEKLNDDISKVKAFSNIGMAYQKLYNYKMALQFIQEALKLGKINNDKKTIANSYHNIGIIFWNLCDYLQALEYFQKSLKTNTELEEKSEIANSLNYIGIIYKRLCKFDKSLEYYLKSLRIAEEIGDKHGIAYSLNNIGILYWNLHNYDTSIENLLMGLKISEEIEDKNLMAITLMSIGNVYWSLENYKMSLDYYQKSLRLSEEIEDKKSIANALNNIGIIYKILNNFDKAIEYYEKSLKIKKELGDKKGIANTVKNIGSMYLKMEDMDKAKIFLEDGLRLAQEIEAKTLIRDACNGLFLLNEKNNDFQVALEYFKQYSEAKDFILNEESSKKIVEMRILYETEKKEKEAEIYRLKNVELANANQQLEKEIIERKKAEETIKIGRERLKTLNKIIWHDLSNDFIVIKSAVNLFKDSSDLKMIDEIEKRADKSLNVITSYRRYESFIDENIDLDEIIVNDLLNKLILDFPDMRFNISGKCKVFADETLNSVFTNLVTNSIMHGNATQIDIKISSKENICIIKFCDNGSGIPNDIIDKIFDEGFCYGKSGHTGVGLHIVRKTIERFGGSVTVDDNEPNGAAFVLNLRKAI